MSEQSHNKKLISSIILVVGLLIFIVAVSSVLRYDLNQSGLSCGEDCPHEGQVEFLLNIIPLLVGFGIMAGAGTYYLMSQRLEVKEDLLKRNSQVLMKFLTPAERKVVDMLIEGHGKILQAEITRLPGMTKVSSHRTIKRLMEKGVIESGHFGKTNIVKLTKEVKEGLLL
ncbi:MAG: hypothetical protein ABIJ92_02015 [Candidatus Aenigmatarchaeota archaeon]